MKLNNLIKIYFLIIAILFLPLISAHEIYFVNPTPENNKVISKDFTEINISINAADLNKFKYSWNKTNYTFFDSSLILKTDFNDFSKTNDTSIYSHTGECVSCPIQISGRQGQAYSFDGINNNLTFENHISLNPKNITFSAWIYANSFTNANSAGFPRIISKEESTSQLNGWSLFFNSSGSLKFNADSFIETNASQINSGQWYFITYTFDGSEIKIYINGILDTFQAQTQTSLPSNNHPITIADSSAGQRNFNGTIDDVSIYNRSFSQQEIEKLYSSHLYQHNQTNWYFYTNQTKNSTTGLEEGTYTYQSFSTESSEISTEQRTLIIDFSQIIINLNSPENNAGIYFNSSNKSVLFNFTATNNQEINMNCNITVNSEIKKQNLAVTNNIPHTESILLNSQGDYYWNVTCWDSSSSKTSQTFYFNYTLPDFKIDSSQISYFPENIIENENITIFADIQNLQAAGAENVTIDFYKNNLESENLIKRVYTSLPKNSVTSVSVNTTYNLGDLEIFVLVDPQNTYNETNISNNNASKTISSNSWTVFTGNILESSSLKLADNSSNHLILWSSFDFFSGNLYVAARGSSVSWQSLQAISKTNESQDSPNDFNTIDNLLGMENYSDSVNLTYTSSGSAIKRLNLTVFNKKINNIPTINSTNNSNFHTSILWDTSDDTNGYFDSTDKEDLIFVSALNKQAPGAYGIYDYEINIPAKLRKYKDSNSKQVTFYLEME